ncbi:MAG: DUF4255 domain-containing protein [Acidobacteriota bacterium]|nr:MAG: DUF4255 domain-containing protein [Acidobacteriota bacterium]
MSNFLSVATVTASLAQYLQGIVQADVPGSTVSTLRPDGEGNQAQGPRVNVYLYQITPNAAFRNSDLPTRDENGQTLQRPRAAVDLHYLLTFYGAERQLEPQRLLGSVVRAIHSRPVLTDDLVRQTIMSPTYSAFLGQSNLAEEIEMVKFTPTTLTLEELTRLWGVFFQTQYTLSVTYQASVVLIESEVSTRSALPVLDRNVYAMPFRRPVIDSVRLDAPVDGPIVAESGIVIRGTGLRGERTLVGFGGSEALGILTGITDTEIKATLPNALRAGIQGLQVEHHLMIGTPPSPHRGFESNVFAFALVPTITPSFARTSADGDTPVDGDMTVAFVPNIGRTQRVKLLLNEIEVPDDRRARAYSFDAPKNNGIEDEDQVETDAIVFHVTGIMPGEYLVRAQVDGAESPVERNVDQSSPDFGKFISPEVTIT